MEVWLPLSFPSFVLGTCKDQGRANEFIIRVSSDKYVKMKERKKHINLVKQGIVTYLMV